ncbi:LysR family transcriptional regulator [Pseudomonas putida]|uniref:LysR family transcriptional regulator n=1 Tax=Pseudomonas putida TaxID=303 RepID=UPI00214F944C|nr:LysR family transcriptional regulator [Pseudomonas putida]UUX70388.1 LysR family transcriptional regulator [Pseudomonas putida]
MDIRRLDLNLLLLLDELYREQNLSAAARRLGMSQPMASASLRRLREYFEDQLFLSTGRGMRPTPFTVSIAASVSGVLERIKHEILAKPAFQPRQSDRLFTISTSDIGALIFVPPILRRLGEDAPNTDLRCVSLPHQQLEQALEQGSVDLAVGYFPDLQGEQVKTQALFEHNFTCIVRRNHPSIGDTLSLEQFLAADHLVVNQEGRSQKIFEQRLRELKLQRRVHLEVPHFMSVPQLIASTNMVATVPLSLGVWFASEQIKMLTPPIEVEKFELKLHWHRQMEDDPAVSWFRNAVFEELCNLDPTFAMSPDYADRKENANP